MIEIHSNPDQSIKFGLLVMCREHEGEMKGFTEPEGTVIFNTLHPTIGTKVVLCDKKEWTVVEDNMCREYNPHIVCELR